MVVAKVTNSSAIFAPIAGFVSCQKLFVQMDIGATLCFLVMGGGLVAPDLAAPGLVRRSHSSRTGRGWRLGLNLHQEKSVCCVLLDEDIFVPVVEKCAHCMSGGVGLGHMAVF